MKYTYERGRLIIRLYPVVWWISAAMGIIVGLPLALRPDLWVTGLTFVGVGACAALTPATIITADKSRATLAIDRWYLFFHVRREYPFFEVAEVQLVSRFSLGEPWVSERRGTYFRVVVVLTSGRVVSLQPAYSQNHRSRVKMAQRLGDFIGVPRH